MVATAAGRRLVKLRGAAQGTGPLVAEWIVAALAEALELRVPARGVVKLLPDTPTDDRDDELAQLLAASVGPNLGFAVLQGARDVGTAELDRLDPAEMAAVLWLDRLVLNPDRTARNPNLLWWHEQPWLIDHGAALGFQYDWPAVTEAAPRAAGSMPDPHLFEAAASHEDWTTWDEVFASRLTREKLEESVATVPASFLVPLLPATSTDAERDEALRRRRAAYVAFLWKRLRAPRGFVQAGPPPAGSSRRGSPPAWLTQGLP